MSLTPDNILSLTLDDTDTMPTVVLEDIQPQCYGTRDVLTDI